MGIDVGLEGPGILIVVVVCVVVDIGVEVSGLVAVGV